MKRTALLSAALAALFLALCSAHLPAQDAEAKDPAAKDTPAEAKEKSPAVVKFDKLFADWKAALDNLRQLQIDYKEAEPDARKGIQEKFDAGVAKAETMIDPLKEAAKAAYKADPSSGDLAEFLAALSQDARVKDHYEESLQIAELLIENNFDNPAIYDVAGVVAYRTMNLDKAQQYLTTAREEGKLSATGGGYLDSLEELRTDWEKELATRKAEDKPADDPMALPRVLLKTNKGDITLEMFENEAPNTVANFVSLVDKDYYDGLTFHRVLPGFMAQGGDPDGTGSGGPGYTIPSEVENEGARKHFRGSLSMAISSSPDSGGSQFFLCMAPTRHLDGRHTVFGRIIDGVDVLAKLQRRDPGDPNAAEPDKILDAQVLRKRDHEYKPRKVGDKPDSTDDAKKDEPKKDDAKKDDDAKKPADDGEKKPAADKPASEKPAAEKPATEKKPDAEKTEAEDGKPSGEKPAEKPSGEKPAEPKDE